MTEHIKPASVRFSNGTTLEFEYPSWWNQETSKNADIRVDLECLVDGVSAAEVFVIASQDVDDNREHPIRAYFKELEGSGFRLSSTPIFVDPSAGRDSPSLICCPTAQRDQLQFFLPTATFLLGKRQILMGLKTVSPEVDEPTARANEQAFWFMYRSIRLAEADV